MSTTKNIGEQPQETGGKPPGLRWSPTDWAACLAARDANPPAPLNETELEELRAAHRDWGADDATMAAIESLGQARTRVVVTGQQPVFMCGPLLTVYKTLQAVRLAQVMAERRGETWTPVFWVASEDHDFEEIRRAWWPGKDGGLEAFALDAERHKPGAMVGEARVTAGQLDGLIAQLERTTHATEFREEALEALRAAYAGRTLEQGFCKLLLRMMTGTGLVIVSPMMRWLRRRAAAVLKREFQNSGRSSSKVIARGEELKAAGIGPALHRRADAVNAFWIDGQGRRNTMALAADGRIECSGIGGGAVARTMTAQTLLNELEESPERFSLNVVTRPLVQDTALPVAAQIVGPGEAAYLAQVEAAYEDFEVVPPIRFPRPEFVILEPRIARQLEKQGLKLEDALGKEAAALAKLIAERAPGDGMIAELDALRERQLNELAEIETRASVGSTAVKGAFEKLKGAMDKGHATVRERVAQERQAGDAQLTRAAGAIAASLWPDGRDQERVLNPLAPFVFNYGWDWAMEFMEELGDAPHPERRVRPVRTKS